MYEVGLNNKSCLFDSATFDTAREAINWASGRGGTYTVNISCPNWPGGYAYTETDTAKKSGGKNTIGRRNNGYQYP